MHPDVCLNSSVATIECISTPPNNREHGIMKQAMKGQAGRSQLPDDSPTPTNRDEKSVHALMQQPLELAASPTQEMVAPALTVARFWARSRAPRCESTFVARKDLWVEPSSVI
ncbi:hypothetical protein KC19_3G049100 [Ceratodon purpureus]|uniref:Uncharacterized protein n=1 Tax=Ceratodon purpureus TaxID=3225 RepID=A0A8T0IEZ5_CERPU|nr:hypothetical protein KC19_3G049100 [Ceratodon purpureus]